MCGQTWGGLRSVVKPTTTLPCERMNGKELGMLTVWVTGQERAGSGAGDAHDAPEALPKDKAVNCYLSNQAVSRLPAVKQHRGRCLTARVRSGIIGAPLCWETFAASVNESCGLHRGF